jgi:hypothetical protein
MARRPNIHVWLFARLKGNNMTTYTITLTDAEDKALGVVAFSQNDWIQNAVRERCRLAIEEIVAAEVQSKLNAGEPVTGTKEDIVMAANIASAAERQAEIEVARAAEMAAMQPAE